METSQLTATELIKATKDELLKGRYTEKSLKGIERVWRNLETYLKSKNIDYFSKDAGMAFLRERYHITETSGLSQSNALRLRAIRFLSDYQAHRKILIRRKRKRYDFGSFEEIFRKFLQSRKNAKISSRTIESDTIYLERFSQYLQNHDIHCVTEIDVPHIQGFIQSTAAEYRTATVYCTACLLRVLFRYLYDQKIVPENLALTVPSVKCSKKSKVPSAYSQEDIRKLLNCVDRAIRKENGIMPYY
jgi:integrase/recombinase XerD